MYVPESVPETEYIHNYWCAGWGDRVYWVSKHFWATWRHFGMPECIPETPNYIEPWQHDGEKLWNIEVLFDILIYFLRISYYNFIYSLEFYVRCRWHFQPTDRLFTLKVPCIGCNGVPRDIGDAARHPEVSTGCLEVFTGQVEPETRSQWLKITK